MWIMQSDLIKAIKIFIFRYLILLQWNSKLNSWLLLQKFILPISFVKIKMIMKMNIKLNVKKIDKNQRKALTNELPKNKSTWINFYI